MSTTIEQARAEWETQGWSVLQGVFSGDQIAAAVATMPELFPTAEQYADGDESDAACRLRQDSHAVMPRFPFEQAPLNELVVHDALLDLAEAFLETKDFILYQGMASAKYSDGPDDDEQMLHVDYGNHTLVVPRDEPGYQQLEMFIYLTDVTPELAATRMVGRQLTAGISIERSYLGTDQYPELYQAEVPAIGPAGSVLIYRPDVYHRGVRMTAPGAARFMLHVSYKPTGTDWLGSQALANACEGLAWHLFIQRATLRQLVALGFPGPGHPYWNAQTLDGVAARYPLLDLSPWRNAFAAGGGLNVPENAPPWWTTAVLYQIYPRSFADSNGDGVGDLPGIIDHLDHLAWLGVDGIWLSPVTLSPNADWGYDVSDFCAVAADYGTLDDVDRLIAEAGQRGIAVMLLVPNHTSDQHPWFIESCSSREAATRDWYVWADPKPDGSAPNNWVSSFGGPAWTLHQPTNQYYLHNHLDEQPDLNWWNPEVRQAFDQIMDFWWQRGVAGYRIDVCNIIIKDAELRDNPPATEEDDFETQMFGQRPVYNANRPEVHEVLRHWRDRADGQAPPRILIGETPVPVEKLVAYYGNGRDELNLAFNFPFISAPFDAVAMREIVESTEAALPPGAWPAWTGSNHDMSRLATRWAGGDTARTNAALLMLLCLRGTAVLYQGDEVGHRDIPVAHEDMRDPLGVRFHPYYEGRDAMRTPMPWRGGPGAGFTDPDVRPWLPVGDVTETNVAAQRDDPASTLNLVHDLIALRRAEPALHSGAYRTVAAPEGMWAWSRGERYLVALNLGEHPATLPDVSGTIRIASDRARDGEGVDGLIELAPGQAVLIALNP